MLVQYTSGYLITLKRCHTINYDGTQIVLLNDMVGTSRGGPNYIRNVENFHSSTMDIEKNKIDMVDGYYCNWFHLYNSVN